MTVTERQSIKKKDDTGRRDGTANTDNPVNLEHLIWTSNKFESKTINQKQPR